MPDNFKYPIFNGTMPGQAVSDKTSVGYPQNFVHLHVHTEYSLLDGMSTVNELFTRVEELGMPGLAITDHGTMMGVMDFMQTAKKFPSVKPIAGCEIYLTRHYDHKLHDPDHKKYYHLILLAKNLAGYHNLCRIASIAGTEGYYSRPRIDHETLKKYNEGLICLSACIGGEVPQAILNDDLMAANNAIEWYKNVFGEDFYLEVCWHRNDCEGQPQEVSALQLKTCNALFELAQKHGVKVVATNDSHFTYKAQARAHDTLLAISCNKLISDTDRLHYTGEEYLKDEKEMLSLFPEHPEVISNTVEVLDKIERFALEGEFSVPVPRRFASEEDRFSVLSGLAREGLATRYQASDKEAERRLSWELEQVRKGSFENYFLFLYDVMRYADSENIWYGPGRGSSVGSILCYCLGINKIDPIRFNLQSERFWNLGRALNRPDVDIDFELGGRNRIIGYLKEQYGEASVSEVITLGCLAPRYAMKSALKAYGVSEGEILRILSSMASEPFTVYEEGQSFYIKPTLANNLKYYGRFGGMIAEKDVYRRAYEDALQLENRKNASGIHACAVLASGRPLSESIPMINQEHHGDDHPAMVSQYDAHLVEETGIVKFDFLELRQLNIIKDTVAESGIVLEEIPLNDKAALSKFRKEDTEGVFLFESAIVSDACYRVMLDNINEVFALNAMCRPGPIDHIPEYIENKFRPANRVRRGEIADGVLDETYGVLVYQEQMNELLNKIGEFSPLESDAVRKIMAKRKIAVLDEYRCRFLVRGMNKGIPREDLVKLWEYMYKMAPLCFMKSHAVAYGMLSYQCAYLKTYAQKAVGKRLDNIYMRNYLRYYPDEQ